MANEVRDSIEEFKFLEIETIEFIKDKSRSLNFFTGTLIMFTVAVIGHFLYCCYTYGNDFSYQVAFLQPTLLLGLATFLKYLSYSTFQRLKSIDTYARYYSEPFLVKKYLNYDYYKDKRKEYSSYALVIYGSSLVMYLVVLVKYILSYL